MLNSQNLAARFLPLREEERKKILKRLPKREGERSQLFDSFDGAWYVHPGSLTLSDDYDHTLNVVVDGDLTVRGTLDDYTSSGHLVVLGDLRAQNLLCRQLTVVTGSVYCAGLIYADDNNYAVEVWGEALQARALVLTDKSARLPEERFLEYCYDDDGPGRRVGAPESLIEAGLRYLGEDGEELDEADRRSGATVALVRPAGFEEWRQVLRLHPDAFRRPFDFSLVKGERGLRVALLQKDCPKSLTARALDDPGWHLDLALSSAADPTQLSNLAGSSDEAVLVAVASHPLTPVDILRQLARHKAPAVRKAVVHHPSLPEDTRPKLARDRRAEVRQQIAASNLATPFLSALARDDSADVRRAASSHADLEDRDRLLLLQDSDPTVKRRAMRFLPESPAWTERLLATDDADLIAWAIAQRVGPGAARTFTEAAQGLFDPRRAVREAWLGQLRHTGELLRFFDRNADRFAADESPLLRGFLAASARGPEILRRLAQDDEKVVRGVALANLAAPEDAVVAEAFRLSGEPIDAVHALLSHPRLSTAALARIHTAGPSAWRLEPHPNMALAAILDRALGLEASLALEPDFQSWRAVAANGENPGSVFAALLDTESEYLQRAARMNAATPIEALLRHARHAGGAKLEEVCLSPALGLKTIPAASLLQFLLNQDGDGIALALAGNPDVPLRVLREAAQRSEAARQRARLTAWQAHAEML